MNFTKKELFLVCVLGFTHIPTNIAMANDFIYQKNIVMVNTSTIEEPAIIVTLTESKNNVLINTKLAYDLYQVMFDRWNSNYIKELKNHTFLAIESQNFNDEDLNTTILLDQLGKFNSAEIESQFNLLVDDIFNSEINGLKGLGQVEERVISSIRKVYSLTDSDSEKEIYNTLIQRSISNLQMIIELLKQKNQEYEATVLPPSEVYLFSTMNNYDTKFFTIKYNASGNSESKDRIKISLSQNNKLITNYSQIDKNLSVDIKTTIIPYETSYTDVSVFAFVQYIDTNNKLTQFMKTLTGWKEIKDFNDIEGFLEITLNQETDIPIFSGDLSNLPGEMKLKIGYINKNSEVILQEKAYQFNLEQPYESISSTGFEKFQYKKVDIK